MFINNWHHFIILEWEFINKLISFLHKGFLLFSGGLYQKFFNYTGDGTDLPEQFDINKLTRLSIDQFITWDEVHTKVQEGSLTAIKTPSKDFIFSYKWDANGMQMGS